MCLSSFSLSLSLSVCLSLCLSLICETRPPSVNKNIKNKIKPWEEERK
uniref:EC79 protein n=1 Tax=Colletotrichum higginsianum TaxID=80884 RepID=I2G7F9_9PEZI|nr:EC79 protein [Colletotrichum higginsianum]